MADESATVRQRRVPTRRQLIRRRLSNSGGKDCGDHGGLEGGLLRYADNVTSQDGEDGILRRLFELLPPPPAPHARCCVDIGAWDGRHLSNTYSLLVAGWRGLLVEADGVRCRAITELHAGNGRVVAVNAKVTCGPGGACPITSLLATSAPPVDFDLLNVDVDGIDYWIVHDALAAAYRPKLVVVEFNPTMPNDLVYIPPRSDDDAQRHGASLAALVELVAGWDYCLVECTMFNAFFLHRSVLSCVRDVAVPAHLVDNIEGLRPPSECPMGTSLYQLYDGSVHLWGCRRAIWHGRGKFDEESLQGILPFEKNTAQKKKEKQSKKGAGEHSKRVFPYAPKNLPDANGCILSSSAKKIPDI